MAQAATLTIAQAFNLAFKCWQAEQDRKAEEARKEEKEEENKELRVKREAKGEALALALAQAGGSVQEKVEQCTWLHYAI